MPDLTRVEVERFIDYAKRDSFVYAYEHLLPVLRSWLNLEQRVRELEESIALKQQWIEMAREAISHCEINHEDQQDEEARG